MQRRRRNERDRLDSSLELQCTVCLHGLEGDAMGITKSALYFSLRTDCLSVCLSLVQHIWPNEYLMRDYAASPSRRG